MGERETNHTVQLIRWMAEDGLDDRIVVGMDAARRRYHVHGGEPGLMWLLDGFTRLLADAGLDEAVRQRLFVSNPARAFAFPFAPSVAPPSPSADPFEEEPRWTYSSRCSALDSSPTSR